MAIKNNFVLLFKAPKSDDETDEYESILSENGFLVKQIKTLDFEYKNLQDLNEKLQKPERYNGIIFSSPRCVYGMKNALDDNELNDIWQKKYNYVVGNGTYETAIKCLNLKCDGKESGNANNLADIMIHNKQKYHKGLSFLYPHGNLKMDLLKSKLSPEEIHLEEICVYDSIPNDKLKEEFDAVTNNYNMMPSIMVFFSPSAFKAAKLCLDKIPKNLLNDIKIVPIGPTTEREIKEQNYEVFAVPKQPTPSAVLNVIKLD